jgi:hypothetical protein
MTRMRVGADEVAALGKSLVRVAVDVRAAGERTEADAWSLGPGSSAAELVAVTGDFEHQRQVLGRLLAELAEVAQRAGGAYVEVEAEVEGRLAGGPW